MAGCLEICWALVYQKAAFCTKFVGLVFGKETIKWIMAKCVFDCPLSDPTPVLEAQKLEGVIYGH